MYGMLLESVQHFVQVNTIWMSLVFTVQTQKKTIFLLKLIENSNKAIQYSPEQSRNQTLINF